MRRLVAGKVEVLTSQVEQVYVENASVFASMSPDEARLRIRLDLENQARMRNYREELARLKGGAAIELRLDEPKVSLVDGGEAANSTGAKEAAVTITEFSDFQCPYCKDTQPAIKRVLKSYESDVRLVFKHLPLEIHPHAFAAAQAAVCAGRQGSFWSYHDGLFAAESLSPETLTELATGLRLNVPEFKACLDSEASRMAVLSDVREAKRLGISGTPAFVVNGRLIRGTLGFEQLKDAVERELNQARRHTSRKQ